MKQFWQRAQQRPQQPLDLSKVSVERLSADHIYNVFACGETPLDRFIKNKAKKAETRLEYRVFVAVLEGSRRCIGYYALRLGSDSVPSTPREDSSYLKGQGYVAFPAVHLGYLAVCGEFQGQGLGRFLLMDAFERTAQISENAGFYALTVQAINGSVAEYYEGLGFERYADGAQPKLLYPIQNVLKTTGRLV